MQLRFDPITDEDDEDRFLVVRDELLDELATWAETRFGDIEGERAGSAGVFVDWKYGYGDAQLDVVTRHDAAEFLLEWCPRKVSAPADAAVGLAAGVATYVEFMADTGRLEGGAATAAEVMTFVADITDDAVAAMGDVSKFGIAKSLFATPLDSSDGSPLPDLFSLDDLGDVTDDEFQEVLRQRMDAFNALPFDERKRVTDAAIHPAPMRVPLSFVHVHPSDDDVAACVATSELVRMVDALVEWLGGSGRPVTGTGAFKLTDVAELVDLLGTGDRLPPEGKLRTSRELPILTLVATVAEHADAVDLLTTKMRVGSEWSSRPVAERGFLLADALLDLGAFESWEYGTQLFEPMLELLDDGVPHWLVGLLPPGTEMELDDVIDMAVEVCREQFPMIGRSPSTDLWTGPIRNHLHELFGILEMAALVEIHGRREETGPDGTTRHDGGVIRGTALMRAVLPPFAHAAGYDFDELPDLAEADGEVIVMAYATGALDASDIVGRWRTGATPSERTAAITSVPATTDDPGLRVGAFGLLEELGDPVAAEPAVRQLLDTPAASHAALYLVAHGLAEPADVDGFVTIGVLVDHLSLLLDEPELMAEMFADANDGAAGDLIDEMWRHDQPETLAVLEALGKALPDKRLAKAARTSAMKHRSWLANRR
ncbi:MAG: hypothetical protein CL424_16980 [Acidimicrobiaceae bacterium]|nr:hypothetical protein [Acidimicrobiaceae bacterium]